jgi:hypothetical protein
LLTEIKIYRFYCFAMLTATHYSIAPRTNTPIGRQEGINYDSLGFKIGFGVDLKFKKKKL